MSGKGFRGLNEAMRALSLASQPCRNPRPATAGLSCMAARTMATTTTPSGLTAPSADSTTYIPFNPVSTVPVTVYNFPSLEPRALESYSTKHLYLPLRRDILHLAVTYEGDNTRQGTANAKTRYEVHGSHRKVYRQKGTGKARVGTKQSPLRKGGGKSFGPHPRDFGTGLNRKVYDLAWRTALSYRYRRGELIVCEDGLELPLPEDFVALAQQGKLSRELEDGFVARYLGDVMGGLRWGKGHGRTTFITTDPRPNLFTSLEVAQEHGTAMEMEDVDVKNLLEGGRIVMERSALKEILRMHRSDLVSSIVINGTTDKGPAVGSTVIA